MNPQLQQPGATARRVVEENTDDLPDEPILFQAQHQMDYEYNVDPKLRILTNTRQVNTYAVCITA